MKNSVTVFTAIFGNKGYKLHDPTYISKNTDYICFTDDARVKSNMFKINLVKPPVINDPDRSAKYIRLFINEYINTENNIYLDAPMRLKVDTNTLIKKYLNNDISLALYKNHLRKNISEEKDYLVKKRGRNNSVLTKQLMAYRSEGFNDDVGLYYTGFMIRKTFDNKLVNFNNLWWNEIKKHSSRTEMSFPYISWKAKLKTNVILDGNVYDNSLYHYLK